MHLAHPLRTQAIAAARVKTNAVDAKTLAHLLRTGLLPEAYIARPSCVICASCCATTRMRTAVKNRVHALLAREGIRQEHADLFGKGGREFLAGLELPDGSRRRLDSLLSLIGDFDREITATTREIDARAKTDERVPVLCQIRGVGRYTAMLVIAEVGDVTRFRTARHLCAWAGLAPTVRNSDGKPRLGHISHQGSPALRWALIEAAQKIPTAGGPVRAMFERIAKRRGRKHRQGRGRPPDPHPPLLRAQGRRDPLPQTPASPTTTTASWPRRHDQRQLTPDLRSRRREVHARASRSCVWPPSPPRAGRP